MGDERRLPPEGMAEEIGPGKHRPVDDNRGSHEPGGVTSNGSSAAGTLLRVNGTPAW